MSSAGAIGCAVPAVHARGRPPLYDPVALAAVKAGAPQPKKPAPEPNVVPKKTTRKRIAYGQPVDPQPDKPEEDGQADDLSCDEDEAELGD